MSALLLPVSKTVEVQNLKLLFMRGGSELSTALQGGIAVWVHF